MSDDIIKDNEGFNQFVATEDDLRELSISSAQEVKKDQAPKGAANKDGTPLIPAQLETLPPVVAPAGNNQDKDLETDYKYVRDNLYTITERSVEALNNLSQIADASQHPRAYEVLSLLVKTIADAQKDLITMHKEKVKIDAQKALQKSADTPEVVNNNLFVGTTAQLDEIIAKMTKKK